MPKIFEATATAEEGSKAPIETFRQLRKKQARQRRPTGLEFLRDLLNVDLDALRIAKAGPLGEGSFLPCSDISDSLACDLADYLGSNNDIARWSQNIRNLQQLLRRSLRDFHFDLNDPIPGRGPVLLADQIKLTFRPKLICVGTKPQLRNSGLSFAKGEKLLRLKETKAINADQWTVKLVPVLESFRDRIYWIVLTALQNSTIALLKFCKECQTFFVAKNPKWKYCSPKCTKQHDRLMAAGHVKQSRVQKHERRKKRRELQVIRQIVKPFDLFLTKAGRSTPDPFVSFVAKRLGKHLGNGTPRSAWSSIIPPLLGEKERGVSTRTIWTALSTQQRQILTEAFTDWNMEHGLRVHQT